jgi:hypothetical protein
MYRLEWIQLPQGLDVFGSTFVLAVAGVMYAIEFVADKVPYIDTIWDGIHTVIRPAAGALLAYGAAGNLDPQWQAVAAIAGGGIALTSHTAKASTRAAVNVSPEPFSNWILSITEDVLSIGLVWLAATHPLIALAAALIVLTIAVYVIWKLWTFAARLFRRSAAASR